MLRHIVDSPTPHQVDSNYLTLNALQIKQYNYNAMTYKEKVLRKENNHPSSSYC